MNSKIRNKIITDLIVAAATVTLLSEKLTGEAIHEWLGVAALAALLTHLLLSFDWFAAVTKRFLQKQSLQTRLNYLFSILLFIAMTIAFYSGLMISKVALPTLGLSITGGMGWKSLHSLSSDASLYIVGLHLALNWKWVMRHMLQPVGNLFRRQPQSLQPQAVPVKINER
jgi:hypothetical protein